MAHTAQTQYNSYGARHFVLAMGKFSEAMPSRLVHGIAVFKEIPLMHMRANWSHRNIQPNHKTILAFAASALRQPTFSLLFLGLPPELMMCPKWGKAGRQEGSQPASQAPLFAPKFIVPHFLNQTR